MSVMGKVVSLVSVESGVNDGGAGGGFETTEVILVVDRSDDERAQVRDEVNMSRTYCMSYGTPAYIDEDCGYTNVTLFSSMNALALRFTRTSERANGFKSVQP